MAALEPREIVIRAYSAANDGDWSRANRYLTPEVRKDCKETARKAEASLGDLRRALPGIATSQRGKWTEFLRVMESLVAPSEKFGWVDIAKGSIRRLWITRQIVSARGAAVSFRVEWRDGSIERDCVHLVKRGAHWRIGERVTRRTPVSAKSRG